MFTVAKDKSRKKWKARTRKKGRKGKEDRYDWLFEDKFQRFQNEILEWVYFVYMPICKLENLKPVGIHFL